MTHRPTPPRDVPDVAELLERRVSLECALGRRPLTVGQVWAIAERIAGVDRQLDAR